MFKIIDISHSAPELQFLLQEVESGFKSLVVVAGSS